jgi:MoaA/NifB/PqqE/SkfB family radical SAM enzyme
MADATRPKDPVQRVVDLQQQAALERRQWVRLSYACNNRCRFCLDSGIQHEAPFVDPAEARARIDEGRAQGATRLILSGGEASIHPDFLELIRYGRQVGYHRVQTITNGRMFAYGRFLRDCLEAGLGEITFSLHSHRAAVHDGLTGVEGSFDQALRGLRRALHRDVIVSVDTVINRENVGELPSAIRWFARLGVTEFDLLHLVPFGRAFDPATRAVPLAVPLASLQAALAETFAIARRRHLVVWTNRLPAPALEGYEHHIQDPHKLEDEVRGRHEHLQQMVEHGSPLPCRDERCEVCYLRHFCDVLHPLQKQVARRELPRLRVTLAPDTPPPDLAPWTDGLRRLWIRAPDVPTALRLLPPGVPEIWELADWSGLDDDAHRAAVAARPLARAVARSPGDLARLSDRDRDRPVIPGDRKLLLDDEGLAWLRAHLKDRDRDRDRDREPPLALGLQTFETLEASAQRAPRLDDPTLATLREAGLRLEGLPPCLGGVAPREDPDDFVDLGSLDEQGRLDPDRYVQRYIEEGYRVHAVRCADCVARRGCPGLHVNLVRAQGFGALDPGRAEGPTRSPRRTQGAVAREPDVPEGPPPGARPFNVNVAWPGARWAPDLGFVFEEVDGAVTLIAAAGCNQRCRYCAVHGQDLGGERTDAELLAQAEAAREAGFHRAFLVGGEPTLRPGLPAMIARLRALGYSRVGLGTNAVRLAEPAAVTRLLEAGLTSLSVSLDSVDPAVQAQLTSNPANPARVHAALRNLSRRDVTLTVFSLMCQPTLAGLPALVDHVADLREAGRARVALALVGLKGVGAAARHPDLMVPWAELRPAWEAACRQAARRALPRLDLHLPPCVFPDPEGRRWDRLIREAVYHPGSGPRTETSPPTDPAAGFPPGVRLRSNPATDPATAGRLETDPGHARFHQRVPACADCEHRPRCAGVDAAHLARFGPDELAP